MEEKVINIVENGGVEAVVLCIAIGGFTYLLVKYRELKANMDAQLAALNLEVSNLKDRLDEGNSKFSEIEKRLNSIDTTLARFCTIVETALNLKKDGLP